MKFRLFIKKLFDTIFSLVVLLISAPVLLIVLPIIKIDSKGPALFKQSRVGKNGKIFKMYKLRTMKKDAPHETATELIDTSHITRVGKILRKTSLDEIPQFFNILKGDMSLIGPRPVVLTELELIELRKELGAYKMLPGITGWAQINGRDSIGYREKAELDSYYVKNWSLRLDIKIFFKTFLPVLSGKDIQEGSIDENKE